MIWALIPCTKKKAKCHCTALEMYWPSTLFRKTWLVAERGGQQPLILSAKYGLLRPLQEIEPYDLGLFTLDRAAQQRWAAKVLEQLGQILTRGDQVVSYLGDRYARYVVPVLQSERGVVVEEPLNGRQLGERLQWLNGQLVGGTKIAKEA